MRGGRAFITAAALAAACLVAGGCASSSSRGGAAEAPANNAGPATRPVAANAPASGKERKNADLNKWMQELVIDVPPAAYRVQAPDAIQITAPSIKELDKFSARLRPDGKVTLNLVGEVYVAGMTPSEIAEDLAKRLERFYNKESIVISVDVTEFKSKKFFVFGQVDHAGSMAYTGSETVIKVLAEAGLNEDAWPEKIALVRPNDDPKVKQKVTIDLKAMRETGKSDQNYVIEEGDLIYVPPSPLAEFRMKTERLLAPVIPVTDLAIMGLTGF